jgi:poly(3-hydroxybutyrate) depolymerase
MRPRWLLGFLLLVTGGACAQSALRPGLVHSKVTCASNPAQDYALYVPSQYDPKRAWPILFAFDAGARGSLPVELARAAAEQHGFIVAGSNQSSNFDPKAQSDAVACLWADTHARLNIDDARIYVTGFSGGSRLAARLAMNCNDQRCIAGVIAHGGGFPGVAPPKGDIHYVYFATVGDLDFNHPEMIELRNQLEERGVPNRLVVFAGEHQWGPAATWADALAWLRIHAMRRVAEPRDAGFIAARLGLAKDRAAQAESSGDLYTAAREYAGIARDFAGLTDVTAFMAKAAELRGSKAWKDAHQHERETIDQQRALESEMVELYEQLRVDDGARMIVTQQFIGRMTDLRERIAREKDAVAKQVEQRALSGVTVMLFEGAAADRRGQRWRLAAAKTEIACASVAKPTRGLVQAALDHARAGDEGAALRNLKRAIENGFKDKAQLLQAPELAKLREKEEFRKLLNGMR